ncbi:hypothetical protein C8J56DRAFT_895817 [Mycena floridula]|nr:hypothetical protein C8J56DRAFT_895817 [Mycena floridula]
MSKTISTGTLGLRFMQNAQKRAQVKEEQILTAKVKDEAEWEVSAAIRESWKTSDSQSVTYEPSYLPFLFPSISMEAEPTKLKGRRVFKKGREVYETNATVSESSTEPRPELTTPERKPGGRPVRVAANRPMIKATSSTNPPDNAQTAKQAIFDNSGVGTDLPVTRSVPGPSIQPAPLVFLKPSGVDDPAEEIIQSARKVAKSKRDRGPEAGETPARKKKRKSVD